MHPTLLFVACVLFVAAVRVTLQKAEHCSIKGANLISQSVGSATFGQDRWNACLFSDIQSYLDIRETLIIKIYFRAK